MRIGSIIDDLLAPATNWLQYENRFGIIYPLNTETKEWFKGLQRVTNYFRAAYGSTKLTIDGVIGPKTYEAVNDVLGRSGFTNMLATSIDRMANDVIKITLQLAKSANIPIEKLVLNTSTTAATSPPSPDEKLPATTSNLPPPPPADKPSYLKIALIGAAIGGVIYLFKNR